MKRKMIMVLMGICILTHISLENVLAFTQYTCLDCPDGMKMVRESRADDIRYQYKTVNGVNYRRLYNFTTRKPLSDWERI